MTEKHLFSLTANSTVTATFTASSAPPDGTQVAPVDAAVTVASSTLTVGYQCVP